MREQFTDSIDQNGYRLYGGIEDINAGEEILIFKKETPEENNESSDENKVSFEKEETSYEEDLLNEDFVDINNLYARILVKRIKSSEDFLNRLKADNNLVTDVNLRYENAECESEDSETENVEVDDAYVVNTWIKILATKTDAAKKRIRIQPLKGKKIDNGCYAIRQRISQNGIKYYMLSFAKNPDTVVSKMDSEIALFIGEE